MASDPHMEQKYEDIQFNDRRDDPKAGDGKTASPAPSVADHLSGESVRDGPPAADDAPVEPAPEDLASRLMGAEQQLEEHRADRLRLQAEMENLRRRSAREIENAHKYALDGFVRELLPVKDSMELGLDAAGKDGVAIPAIREGMSLTMKMLASALEKFGVEEVSPALGDPFDHERHQAISVAEDKEKEPGAILTIVQKGVLLNGRLVRPAMVIVNK